MPGHTCSWLYRNMVVDATGRSLPCCGAPRPDTRLVFGNLAANPGQAYNSERYLRARSWFRGPTDAIPDDAPHCARCEWDQDTVNIGDSEILRYFRAADPLFFDRRSLRSLTRWQDATS